MEIAAFWEMFVYEAKKFSSYIGFDIAAIRRVKPYCMSFAGGPFKERYRNHTKSFRHQKYSKETELSKHIWDLKKGGVEYNIKWEIIRASNTNIRKSGICNLCLKERFEIMKCEKLLNRRSELVTKCRHGNNTMAGRVKKRCSKHR